MKVKPVNCVASYRIIHNIVTNLDNGRKLGIKWLGGSLAETGKKAVIASAGPSLEAHLGKIKEKQKEGYSVFCVKHALPTLAKGGIVPEGVVILDPRPVTGTSTHDVVRTELFDALNPKTVVYAASMTHPSVIEYCSKKGNKVVGWHAFMEESKMVPEYYQREYGENVIHPVHMIGGGTCSGVRAILLLQTLGYAVAEMVGFDFEYRPEPNESFKDFTKRFTKDIIRKNPNFKVQPHPDGGIAAIFNEKGTPKYARSQYGSYEYWASGELIAGVQDLDNLFRQTASLKIKIDVWDECGMSSIVFKALGGNTSSQQTLEQFLNN